MADLKISQFADGNAIQETDEVATNRAGVNTKVKVGSMAAEDASDYTPTSGLGSMAFEDNADYTPTSGLGSMAFEDNTDYTPTSGLGSAAFLDTGTSIGDIVVLEDVGGNPALPAVDGSQLTGIIQQGMVLQTLQTVKTDIESTSSNSFTSISGLSQAITPSSASNKVLVTVNLSSSVSSSHTFWRLLRNGTPIAVGDAAGSRIQATNALMGSTMTLSGMCFLDTPATTSPVTYSLDWRVATGAGYINRNNTDTDGNTVPRCISTITVQEIKG